MANLIAPVTIKDPLINETETSIGKQVWNILKEGKYTIGVNAFDFGARFYSVIQYKPQLKAAVAVTAPNAALNGASNLSNNGASIAQLDATTDGVGYVQAATNDVSAIANALIWQEVVGSTFVILVQAYSIYEVWKELRSSAKVIKETNEKIQLIETDVQMFMTEIEKLNQLIDEIKGKKVEQVTLVDTQELVLQLSKCSLLSFTVYQPISELRITVSGKIQTLKSAKSSLIRDEILCGGQIVAHLAEFVIYSAFPMGPLFWCVKGGFTLVYIGITAAKGVQHYKVTKKRLKVLQAKWQKLEEYNKEITKIVKSLIDKQAMVESLFQKAHLPSRAA